MTLHLPELSKQAQHYADIRRRLLSPAPKPKPVKIEAIMAPVIRARQIPPMWKSGNIHFDAHVVTWQSIFPHQRIAALLAENCRLREALRISKDDESLLDLPKRPAREIIDDVLSKYPGITLRHIRTRRAARAVIEPRDACIVAIHDERADMSPKQIGDLFDIDRTTVNYVVLKAAAERGDLEAQSKVKHKKERALDWHHQYGRTGKRVRDAASQ